ncbi:MAG: dihydrofolate reductase [Sphingobacteriaceae bacterium]|nr:MAG: dihydrofolate reductase [Sphingobacteriaceae bacterium]
MTINMIAAMARNNAIGLNNQLLWHLPNDLKHFKEITTGHTVVMGRKTYDSVGKPLPNRRNIVITRQKIQIAGCEVANSLEDALDLFIDEDEVFIVGGAEIYRQAMDLSDRIYLTLVHKDIIGDTYFPDIETTEWEEIEREDHPADEKNPLPYSFITFKRR